MDFHVVAVDQAQHVDAGGLVEADGGVAVDGLAADDAAGDVDHLQGGVAGVADGPAAAVEEGEGLGGLFVDAVGAKHQAEAARVVVGASLEGVVRGGEQVDVGAGHIIDEVEVVHVDVLGLNGDGIGAVFAGAEADGHFALGGAVGNSHLSVALRDVDASGVVHQVELIHHATIAEAYDGIVDDRTAVTQHIDVEQGDISLGVNIGSRQRHVCAWSLNKETSHGRSSIRSGLSRNESIAIFIHGEIVEALLSQFTIIYIEGLFISL